MKNPRISVVQATPVLFELSASLDKVEYWVEQAAKENPDLVLFPEAFIPGYPKGLTFGTTIGNRSEQSKENWQYSLKYIALEGRCFVCGCNQYVEKQDYPDLPGEDLSAEEKVVCNGGSVIIDPFRNTLAGPLWGEEGILTTNLDRNLIAKSKLDFDPVDPVP